MIEYRCPKHNCLLTSGKCFEIDIDEKTGEKGVVLTWYLSLAYSVKFQ